MENQGGGLSPSSFDDYNAKLQAAALKATKYALSLPSDLTFHQTMNSDLAEDLDSFSSRVLSMANDLLALVETTGSSNSTRAKGKMKLESQDDVVDNFHSLVVDSMDQLLERTDTCLDEFLGRRKAPAIAINPTQLPLQKSHKPNASRGRLDPTWQHASHLPKPQLSFKTKVDNTVDSPWHPTLRHKYNAQVPLGYIYRDSEEDADSTKLNLHPYQYEIKHTPYPPSMFQIRSPQPPKILEETPLSWVSTSADFSAMLEKLRQATELAVDLEHHSYRTFSGFLCLMQISTRDEDFIVDTLALREELSELNEVFTDPRIVKVFHGAESDIVWLQQDFNLYIVNLFDTFHASKAIGFPKHGLASLLEMYCDFTPDKQYQLADWRMRPLPDEMLAYARSDTHYLLFIYDNLRNALIDLAQSRAQSSQNESSSGPAADPAHALIRQVLFRSEETALRVYERELYDAEDGSGPGGWDGLARKWNKGTLMASARGSVRQEVYRSVHAWRDRVSREEDESTRYVLPNHYLFQLAEQPPSDMPALLAFFQHVPPVIRRRAKELLDSVRDAVARYGGSNATLIEKTESITISEDTVITDLPSPNIVDQIGKPAVEAAISRLWPSTTSTSSITTQSSSLLGSTASSSVKSRQVAYSALRSSLFGPKLTPAVPPSDVNTQFKDIVSRIHSTLVIVPSAPKIVSQIVETTDQKVVQTGSTLTATATKTAAISHTDLHPNGSAGPMEIPYVPQRQRQANLKDEPIDDSIVIVGQARQKKRKRPKTLNAHEREPGAAPDESDAGALSNPKKAKKEEREQAKEISTSSPDIEPFDYSVAPNMLDNGHLPREGINKRNLKRAQKKNREAAIDYGNFRAPPQAYREVKSGNKTHTFK
ncbi:hypothetical protein SERLA73DRAFT_91376 [Serpula lacrymans var. lacrymans S7.3]|uniref:HRDC domain-containing protein n=2 Tax=Serpula lacrymans var. lacrymans TaxID=341189 RepID=F8Q1G5_SERL3|nr:uncharacterized protein SERLADRAFT_450051 [Serpula lacrymans var. lacrymans S7.9]EGN98143.1 hypothetical protein SERLA73DRAFT_91376 [Serpula lacrymans var. lacrymans S7.3]EGO23719.1 hypothetical protein SERLADRAFT_450051 [Serpula lacrymans var. lacrymans S7.9]